MLPITEIMNCCDLLASCCMQWVCEASGLISLPSDSADKSCREQNKLIETDIVSLHILEDIIFFLIHRSSTSHA